MKKNLINRVEISGRIYKHTLERKISGPTSKNPGTPFINGTIEIATDEKMLNIVKVKYTYVTEKKKDGGFNKNYIALNKIIDECTTVIQGGKDNASIISITSKISVDDNFDPEQFGTETNPDGHLCYKFLDGGFIQFIDASKLKSEDSRNTFDLDFLITGTRLVEANEERGTEEYLVVKGYIINSYSKVALEADFRVEGSEGIDYFESLSASESEPVFTKISGSIIHTSIQVTTEEKVAFGKPVVKEVSKNVKKWLITSAAEEPYTLGDETTLTGEELKEALANREKMLVAKKASDAAYRESRQANAATNDAVPSGSKAFNF